MTTAWSGEDALRHAIVQITKQAEQVSECERIGFLKGAVRNYPNLPEPDRIALFNLLVLAGTGIQHAKPGAIYVNQSVNQNANPQINQTANSQVNQSVSGQSKTGEVAGRRAWGLALLAAAAALGAATITARCSREAGEAARRVDSVATGSTKSPTKSAAAQEVNTIPNER